MTTISVKGLAELNDYLQKLPLKLEQNVMRGALRAGLKPIKETAISNAPIGDPDETAKKRYKLYPGALRDSIRIGSSRINKKAGNISARLTAGGTNKKNGANVFYAHIVEFGSAAHSLSDGGKGEINHPGTTPRPFLRPALDSQANNAVLSAAEYVRNRLKTKHGIDTPDVSIGAE